MSPPPADSETHADHTNQINLPITLYILDDQQQYFSSKRTANETIDIQTEANTIWAQAHIHFTIHEIRRVTVPLDMTGYIIRRQFNRFFEATQQLDPAFHTSTPISGFYVQTLKGDNGLQPSSHPAYFIADNTLNTPGRTVAHELGHILGLTHTNNDPTRLMHSGASGIRLTDAEIDLARQRAKRLLTQK